MNLDASVDAARPWVEAADPRPTYPILLDPAFVVPERYGMMNIPSVVWIDEDGDLVRAPTIAPGDDTFRSFTNVDSSTHHEALRRWVIDGEAPPAEAATASPPDPALQQARAERRLAAALHAAGRSEAAEAHFAKAEELAPLDFTIVRGSMLQRGLDPFGTEFFEFWQRWEDAGRPGYGAMG